MKRFKPLKAKRYKTFGDWKRSMPPPVMLWSCDTGDWATAKPDWTGPCPACGREVRPFE